MDVCAIYGDFSITILLKLILLFILPVIQSTDVIPLDNIRLDNILLDSNPLDNIQLENDTPVVISLDETSPIILAYQAQRGDIINIIARAITDIDVVLEVLTPDNARIAFNDNHHTMNSDISASDAVIEHLSLGQAGIYLIRVDSFNGASVGDVEITLENEPEFELVFEDENQRILRVDLYQNEIFIYKLEPENNELITVTVEASGITDTVLSLFDENGALIAENDDYTGAEVFISSLSSRIEDITIEADSAYELHISEFLGRPATVTVIIETQSAE